MIGQQTIRDRIASANERAKLLSTFLNAIGLGLIGFGVIRPLTDGGVSLVATSWIAVAGWCVAGLAFHAAGHYFLGYLRKEKPNEL